MRSSEGGGDDDDDDVTLSQLDALRAGAHVAYVHPVADRAFDRDTRPFSDLPQYVRDAGETKVAQANVRSGHVMRFLTVMATAAGRSTVLARNAGAATDTVRGALLASVQTTKMAAMDLIAGAITGRVEPTLADGTPLGDGDPAEIGRHQGHSRLSPRELGAFLMATLSSREPGEIGRAYDAYAMTYTNGGALRRHAQLAETAPEIGDVVQLLNAEACVPGAWFFDFSDAERWGEVKRHIRTLFMLDAQLKVASVSPQASASLEQLDPAASGAIDVAYSRICDIGAVKSLGSDPLKVLMMNDATYAQFARLCGLCLKFSQDGVGQRQYTPVQVVDRIDREIKMLVNAFRYNFRVVEGVGKWSK